MGPRGDEPERVSLLVRNLPLDVRQEDVRDMFQRYGEVRDIYLPKDYYTGKPRGFGFVEFRDNRDAEDALYALDRTVVGGREVSVGVRLCRGHGNAGQCMLSSTGTMQAVIDLHHYAILTEPMMSAGVVGLACYSETGGLTSCINEGKPGNQVGRG
ncbi:hypothetical protein V8C86DRAFT_2679070, partial [Haematococcus lacustris]